MDDARSGYLTTAEAQDGPGGLADRLGDPEDEGVVGPPGSPW
jgi:hypothetical protein